MDYAPRITVSYADASGVFAEWAQSCEQMCVYEHEADLQVPSTHVHILMLGCTLGKEALKRKYYKMLPEEQRKGNALWSWDHKDHKNINKSFITYMSKGKLRPKFVKNFPVSALEELQQAWVEPVVRAYLKEKAPHKATTVDERAQLITDSRKHFKDYPNYTLDQVRSWTMKWYLTRDNWLPNVGVYKRNAASIYVLLSDLHGPQGTPESVAIEEIKNLWY